MDEACVTTHMKGNEQYIHVVVFILPYIVVLTLTPWMKP